jgi:hypothetical protein
MAEFAEQRVRRDRKPKAALLDSQGCGCFRQIVNMSPDSSWLLDPYFCRSYCNAELATVGAAPLSEYRITPV